MAIDLMVTIYFGGNALNYAKANHVPLILVTSERKEDWWEEISGANDWPQTRTSKRVNGGNGVKEF